jgi:hypothetical protein
VLPRLALLVLLAALLGGGAAPAAARSLALAAMPPTSADTAPAALGHAAQPTRSATPTAPTTSADAPATAAGSGEIDPASIDGNRFTGPRFGFRVVWDPHVWTVQRAGSPEGIDTLELGDGGPTEVEIYGLRDYGGDPDACLADFVAEQRGRPEVSAFAPAEDFAVPTAPDAAVSALHTLTWTFPDGRTENVVWYAECRPRCSATKSARQASGSPP